VKSASRERIRLTGRFALPTLHKVFTLTEFVGEEGEVPDPYGTARHAYRQVRDQIRRLVEEALEKIALTAKR
jgi:protein-tyrosine-phosphatase